jgi:transforming growth factor-beta-induced protein
MGAQINLPSRQITERTDRPAFAPLHFQPAITQLATPIFNFDRIHFASNPQRKIKQGVTTTPTSNNSHIRVKSCIVCIWFVVVHLVSQFQIHNNNNNTKRKLKKDNNTTDTMKLLSPLLSLWTASTFLVTTTTAQTLSEVAEANGLTTLLAAATATGQIAALEGTDDLTLFGPTNAAFDALPTGAVPWLLQTRNLGILSQIVGYHVLPGVVRSMDLSDGLEVTGKTFNLANDSTGYTVNGANIGSVDLAASNGILHIIDQVLFPPGILEGLPSNVVATAAANPDFQTLVQAIGVADLATALTEGTFTVFAPTEAAFADLPLGVKTFLLRFPSILSQVLQYHVISAVIPSASLLDGSEILTLLGNERLQFSVDTANNVTLINGVSAIEATDIETLNGLIHAIDQVLIPPGLVIAPSVADVAIETGQFNSLLFAVQTANLGAALNVPGPLSTYIL